MMVSICIPTTKYRKHYLLRCLEGYKKRTNAEIQWLIKFNASGCGEAWQWGADKAKGDYIHFSNDDIVPSENWIEPCIEACEKGKVPVVGVAWGGTYGLERLPLEEEANGFHYYEDMKDYPDWSRAPNKDHYYPSLPFCSKEQWENIGPMIASHYGTDKWFGWRAKQAGYWPVVRTPAKFFHYTASSGRDQMIDGWTGLDRLTFDQNIAYPLYQKGELDPLEKHPEWNTIKGRNMARAWYMKYVPKPKDGWPWEILQFDREGNAVEGKAN
jgi:hypothetical protein